MSTARVRINDNGSYDVLLGDLTKTEAMAVREGFSALEVNQEWAYFHQGSLTDAVRSNSTLAKLHQEYKDTIRDVNVKVEDEDYDTLEEVDEFEELGFTS